MPEPPPHIWPCPACGRRVPRHSERCHCGMTRLAAGQWSTRADAVVPRRFAGGGRRRVAAVWRTFPRDVKGLVVASGFVLLAGVSWTLFAPRTEDRTPPVLGYLDAPLEPTPRPLTRPPFKLPWWR